MRFFKDHPKEIEAGGAGGAFPPPFRPAVAAATAWPPKLQDVAEARGVEEPKASPKEKEEEEEDEYVSTLPHSPA
jgi:hypothetical protein